jgi:hypothetical protein
VNPTGPPAELLQLTQAPAFLARVRGVAAKALERYEPAIGRPDYASQVASELAEVLAVGLRSETTEARTQFLDSFVRDGLAAGASAPMLVRRFTFLLTCLVAELAGSLSPAARSEGSLWLAGFASGSICDLLFALERQSPRHELLP